MKTTINELRNYTMNYSANEENGKTSYQKLDNWLHEPIIKTLVKSQNWFLLSELMQYFFKSTDCGKYGKMFEIMIKLYLNGYKGNSCIVSARGKVDVTWQGHKIEVKSNCGELDDVTKSDYVIYTYDNQCDVAFPNEARITTTNNFIDSLSELNLIRMKKTTGGYIKRTIQSYKNSKKKFTAWTNTVDRWLKIEQVKSGLYEV